MAIDFNVARLLLSARQFGVCFRSTATIGRLNFSMTPELLTELLVDFSCLPDQETLKKLHAACWSYAEPFLEFLGSEEIVSIDASGYENATCVHDMNLPIAPEMKSRFDVVIDGGTLEHVFNFPVAIRNCMEMVKVGGHFLGVTTANNYCGHGFYQFSPELFFRVFSGENGFTTERVLISEVQPNATWFEAMDPDTVNRRVEFINDRPTYILVQARRLAEKEVFRKPPQQSDYVSAWSAENGPPVPVAAPHQSLRRFVRNLEARLPAVKFITQPLLDYRRRRMSCWLGRTEFLKPISRSAQNQRKEGLM
jgi:hypothetical protein